MPEVNTAPEMTSAQHVEGTTTLTGAAFFDVDNTVMRGTSLFQLARKMYERKAFTLRQAVGFALKQAKFLFRGESMEDIHSIQNSALTLAAGISAESIKEIGEEVYDELIESKIWPGARALTNGHLKSGREVWLVTATPVEMADVIARRLGLTGALGTVGEIVDGQYTGKLVGELLHGEAKARAIEALAAEKGFDLTQCWAYSDSHNDVPLLSAVGHPVAINPDLRLRKHAREHNWPAYDFRAGRRAATLGLRLATVGGVVYGLWRGFKRVRNR